MPKRRKFSAAVAMLALAACDRESGKLTIRSTPAPVSSVAKPVSLRVAEARGHLALGNVALALESYRKAAREEPDNVEALAGVAGCYDRMGRFDLSQRNYEAALALAPRDPTLLAAFAASLDLQGRSYEAAGVRAEIKAALAAANPPVEQAPVAIAAPAIAPSPVIAIAPSLLASAQPETIKSPAPRPAPIAAAPRSVVAPVAQAAVPALAPARTVAIPKPKPAPIAQAAVAAAVPAPAPSPSVTIPLPQPKPVAPAAVVAAEQPIPAPTAPSATADQSPAAETAAPTPPAEQAPPVAPESPFKEVPVRSVVVEPHQPAGAGPRLERVSLGEVALVTTTRPQWRAQTVQRTDRSTTIRFVSLQTASARTASGRMTGVRTAGVRPAGIRLLNAARYRGLAANTRSYLAVRGWRRLEIGDAPSVRQTSLILYPPSRRATAKRLAAQFGFAIASRPEGSELVMLIGRDATRPKRHTSG